ncbi:uncharacterized protein TA14925 [Theileria annulata]|uniref:Uncharacterized protein n=1 Tax=Theileria annulata TaxID=5874 RepID=Q4UFA7_THEAN|nr:uncharacterized protein TA14925 [Theileria annulata]CAI74232.1 hypothetical protein TA14925 [Theileria annulata]|eukprot:XP_951964.1 hypothetical protein TA14925 [Theileria annulata]
MNIYGQYFDLTMDFSFSFKRIGTVFLWLTFLASKFSKSHFCPENICKLCCKPTQSGCVNGFVQNYNQALTSVSLACQDCNCSNPQIGCGWAGRRFKRVECNSCSTLNSLIEINPELPVAGCGKSIIDGALVYTS